MFDAGDIQLRITNMANSDICLSQETFPLMTKKCSTLEAQCISISVVKGILKMRLVYTQFPWQGRLV